MQDLAKEIYDWCQERGYWGDNIIYFNDKAWNSQSVWGIEQGKQINVDLYEYENKNPRDYIEYANPDTITMSFEGNLYDVLNYGNGSAEEELQKLFEKYDLYWEYGYAWSLSAYEL